MTVVVVIAHRDAVAVPARHRGDPGCASRPRRSVAAVAKQPVARVDRVRVRGETPPLDAIDVEEAVPVVVKQADAAARHLGELVD